MLDKRSLGNLQQVHPHLVAIIERTAVELPKLATDLTFQITCGARTKAEQLKMVATGKSKTTKSRHLIAPNGYAHAVDIAVFVGGKLSWELRWYKIVAGIIKEVAKKLGYPIEWGGDWATFIDGPHFQLPNRKPYEQGNEDAVQSSVLKLGARGPGVVDLQKALNEVTGSNLIRDGRFGSQTEKAVKALQSVHGLKTDGIVGPKTWAVLNG